MNTKNTDNYMLMTSAYTLEGGHYIGNEEDAKNLNDAGIMPELASPDHKVCSIGFCEKEQKWYGWSHRARYGFAVGSEVKKGDCAYSATDKDDFLQDMIRFWSDETHIDVKGEHTKEEIMEWIPVDFGEAEQKPIPTGKYESGVRISWTYSDDIPNKEMRNQVGGSFQVYPKKYGKGEWKAKTLEDAKQMAIDFAEGVR